MAEPDENVAPVPEAGGAKNKILPLLLIINTLLLTGVLIFVMKKPSAHAEGKEKGEKGETATDEHGAPKEGSMEPLTRFENFTVQLKSAEIDRYARMSLELESPNDASKAAIERRMPPIRDAILGYLTDRTAEELRGSDGLRDMKNALLKRLEELVPGKRISNVFITDFIIQ